MKIYGANPYLPFVMGLDPQDRRVYGPLWKYREAKPGNLVIWDAHFGPNENRVLLETLTSDQSLAALQHWVPARGFSTLNGYQYEVYAFQKR